MSGPRPAHATAGLLRRDAHNPILTTRDLPHTESAVFNPGAVLFEGETLLLVRIEDRGGVSRLGVARSVDGVTDWRVEEPPALWPATETHPEEANGIEDPRITFLPALARYGVAYTAYSRGGPLVALVTTTDFVHFDRLGPVLPPENKDAALFPEQFGGRWALLHRPTPGSQQDRAHIWIAFSPDLQHWGGHRLLLPAHRGRRWDAGKIGLSAPPLRTDEGWLLLYHAVHESASEKRYYIGLALLDADDPTRVLRRSSEWILAPEASYERDGRGGGVVFPCGWVQDGDDLRIYYGAADHSVALAHARVSELLRWLRRHEAESEE